MLYRSRGGRLGTGGAAASNSGGKLLNREENRFFTRSEVYKAKISRQSQTNLPWQQYREISPFHQQLQVAAEAPRAAEPVRQGQQLCLQSNHLAELVQRFVAVH